MQKTRLFLLHFGGGNRYSFQFLKPHLVDHFEFLPLELPGRGRRMNEPLLVDDALAVKDYVNQINGLRDNAAFVIYGHSMGASLGLRVTKELENLGIPPKT